MHIWVDSGYYQHQPEAVNCRSRPGQFYFPFRCLVRSPLSPVITGPMSDTTSHNGHLGYSGEDSGAVASAGPSVASQMSDPGDDTSSTANNVDDSPSAVAKALSFMLSSVIRDFDSRAEDTVRSQDQVSFDIDRLTGELDQLLADAPLPFLMQHAARISGVRKRVSSLNVLLKSIQRRLDNVDQVLFVGLPHEKAAVESARQH